MNFNSLSFFIFIGIFLGIYSFTSIKKKYLIFFMNLTGVFLLFLYAKKHLIVLLILVSLVYLLCKWAKFSKQKLVLPVSILLLTLPFLFFRYDFFSSLVIQVLPSFNMLKRPALFLGMAFLFLKSVSIIVDTKQEPALKPSFIDIFNFLLFIPCFVAGPIDRLERFKADQENQNRLSLAGIYFATFRITFGLFKKLVIADSLYPLTLADFNSLNYINFQTWQVLLCLYLYTITLYFDFSGYSDIAIGLSRLFGIRTPENFNNPFIARNIQDFWNRWHISFMHWLRDYLYFPLYRFFNEIGFKSQTLIMALSFVLTFSLAGIWHGDGLQYLYTGLFYGLCFAVWVLYKRFLEKRLGKRRLKNEYMNSIIFKVIGIFITLNVYTFSLIIYLKATDILEVFFEF